MGFYNNYNFDGLKLFSQLQKGTILNEPCQEFVEVVNYLKSTVAHGITVAEIGLGYGATALQILKRLDEDDVYYCFDFEDRLNDFASDLQARDFGIKCEVVLAGNSHYVNDSYNWNLSKLIFSTREQNLNGLFDAVYLDGAHTFLYSGLAICMLKELIKNGGFLILDDLFWTVANSPTCRDDAIKNKMPKEQMEDMQILRAQEIFLSRDQNFEKLSPPDAYRGIFRKRLR